MKKLVAKITIAAAAVMLVGGGLLVMPKEVNAKKVDPTGKLGTLAADLVCEGSGEDCYYIP